MYKFTEKENLPPKLKEQIKYQLTELKDAASSITISSDHLKDIVDTVLNVSSLESNHTSLQKVVFEPSQILARVTSMFKVRLAEKKIALNHKVPQQNVLVVGDPYRFKVFSIFFSYFSYIFYRKFLSI